MVDTLNPLIPLNPMDPLDAVGDTAEVVADA